jgi:hypothetical protein
MYQCSGYAVYYTMCLSWREIAVNGVVVAWCVLYLVQEAYDLPASYLQV